MMTEDNFYKSGIDTKSIDYILKYLKIKDVLRYNFFNHRGHGSESENYLVGYGISPIVNNDKLIGYKYRYQYNSSDPHPVLKHLYLDQPIDYKPLILDNLLDYLDTLMMPMPPNLLFNLPPGDYTLTDYSRKYKLRQLATFVRYSDNTLCADGDSVIFFWNREGRFTFWYLYYNMGILRKSTKYGYHGSYPINRNNDHNIVKEIKNDYDYYGYAQHSLSFYYDKKKSIELSEVKINGVYEESLITSHTEEFGQVHEFVTISNNIIDGLYHIYNSKIDYITRGTFANRGEVFSNNYFDYVKKYKSTDLEKKSIYKFTSSNSIKSRFRLVYLNESNTRHGICYQINPDPKLIFYNNGVEVSPDEYLKVFKDEIKNPPLEILINWALNGKYPEIYSIIQDYYGRCYDDYISDLSEELKDLPIDVLKGLEGINVLNEVGEIIYPDTWNLLGN